MCGIVGVYAFHDNGKRAFQNIPKALETLKQRGPENQKQISVKNACLGHTRLAIIDLSEQATQPMTDASGRYTIVFNGEIYNYKELGKYLKNKGVHLKTASDTEVLLQLYIYEGEHFLTKLNGFFSFAIYDSFFDRLFLARDRMGIKPLLYFFDQDKLFFASEMKALLALGIDKTIDEISLREYFQFNYIPSPNSIFKKVKKLPQGNFLTVENKKININNYYSIPYKKNRIKFTSYEDAQKELQKLIEESVKERLISDVSLGSFLSGGIDSSVIVAEVSKHTSHLNTFSIGYKDEAFFDETVYAELVAKKFKTNHHTFKLSNSELYENLYKVLNYIDEPFADSSALPLYILSMYTKKHVTVALSGDGADELFSGYNKHKAHFMAIENSLKSKLIKLGLPFWENLPKSRNGKISNRIRQLEKYARGLSLNDKERYLEWASIMSENKVNQLFIKKRINNSWTERQHFFVNHFSNPTDINDVLFADMQLVLVGDMLHKVDSMSMANSLEVRTPFLDPSIVQFAFSLPESFKINTTIKKRILQDTYRFILPSELYQRPKHGFEVPLLKWFRTTLKNEINEVYLNKDFIHEQGIFNYESISALKNRLFSKNPQDVHAHLWAFIVFQHWWKKYQTDII